MSSVGNGEPRMVVEEEKSIARSSLWMMFLIRACVATGPRAHLCLLPCEPATSPAQVSTLSPALTPSPDQRLEFGPVTVCRNALHY